MITKDLVVFYTLGVDEEPKCWDCLPNQFYQTVYSIYTLRKIWDPDPLIILYTNVIDWFSKVFVTNPVFRNVEFREIPKEYERETYYYSLYGHARNFLVYDLLKEFETTILYLDPDTGVRADAEPDSWKYFLKLEVPHLYRPETYNRFNFWSGKVLADIINLEKKFKIPNDSIVFNNGVMVFPYNEKSLGDALYLREAYDKLYKVISSAIKVGDLESKDICFTDMFSASIVAHQKGWKTLYPANFFNVIVGDRIPGDLEYIPILHYYNGKNNPKYQTKWKRAKEVIKRVVKTVFAF